MLVSNLTATEYVQNLQVKGSKYGLKRTRSLLDALSSPDDKLKIIHVAGTNGKGSMCAYITQILLAAGKSVGTFTSPAVYSYEEQFLVNGVASADLCEKYLAMALDFAQKMEDKPTAFEIETCAALAMFAGEGCEYAVVECGLGGLTDSTNAINKKEIAVIGSISLEHTAILGNTVLEIAGQKAGIIKNCPAVVNALQDEEVLRYFGDIGGVIAPVPQNITESRDGCKFTVDGEEYAIKMHGMQQAYNAATAVRVCEISGIDKKYIHDGLAKTCLNGRIEVIEADKTYILDGAHNPASFAPLAQYLKNFGGKDITIIYGCLSDKDTVGCLKQLGGIKAKMIVVQPQSYRAKALDATYAAVKAFFGDVTAEQSVEEALEQADSKVIAVCGTFTILKEAKGWIGKRQ